MVSCFVISLVISTEAKRSGEISSYLKNLLPHKVEGN